ncbi:MAG: hypothetical protein RL088_3987 [Verrucomicrobiota bacterium]|jgi:O-acetyl-ADP-ribose deacetylase (regulator of RNase III)
MKPFPTIKYATGDATRPVSDGSAVIVHICNDIGGWGRGFVVAISKRWKSPEEAYRLWHAGNGTPFALGEVQFIEVEPQLWVANMIAQRDVRRTGGAPPIRYEALRLALSKVAAFCAEKEATVHMPRIGCGLAGGDWAEVSRIVDDELGAKGISVTVYDFP